MSPVRPFEQHTPTVDPEAWLDPTCLVIGDVHIGRGSTVWPGVVIRGDIHRIRIGQATNVQDGSVLHNSHESPYRPDGAPLIIGDRVTIGHRALLHGCEIADDCLVGMGAIVMDEAVVEREVMIGAGALVPPRKVLQSGYLYTGSPARKVRALTNDERDYLAYSADFYVALGERHRRSLRPDPSPADALNAATSPAR
jgi:carbonic anhydrase/acetyltransferase-like protein (isoleucine patch superfamily)